jgi:PEP-CTERM motif
MKKLFTILVMLGSAVLASASSFTLTGVGGNVNHTGTVYVYPYNIQVSGAPGFNGDYLAACDSYLNHVSIGETWGGTVNNFGTLWKAKYSNSAMELQKYDQAAWLVTQFSAHPSDVSDINYAIWARFQPNGVAGDPNFNAGAQNYLSLSALAGNLATVDRHQFLIFTPTDFSRSNVSQGPQEFIAYVPNRYVDLPPGEGSMGGSPLPTPEPGTIAMIGTGLFGLGGLLKKKRFVA